MRVVDVSGDGLADVVIDDCATCGVAGPLVGEVVSFDVAETGELRGRTLWTVKATDIPYPYHQGTDAVLLGLGDGRPLLGMPTLDDYRLLDGETGAPVVVVPRGQHWVAQTAAIVAKSDQVLLLRAAGNAQGGLPPVLLSLIVSPDLGEGNFSWEYAADVYSTLELSETSVSDLDGDGELDVVLTERARDGSFSLIVLDATTGSVRSRVAGWRLEGVAPARVRELPAIIVSSARGLRVATYRDGAFTPIGEPLGDWEVTSVSVANPILVAPIRPSLASFTSPQGTSLLVGHTPKPDAAVAGRHSAVGWARITDFGLRITERYTPPDGVTAVYAADGATRPYPQFALGTTDGAVTVLDRLLRPSNGSLYRTQRHFWGPAHSTRYAGIPVGGRAPARANLIGNTEQQPFIVVPNTAMGTMVADARTAGLVIPPTPRWTAPALVKPSVFETADGTVLAGVEGQRLTLRDARVGTVVASAPLDVSTLGPLGSPHNEPLLLEHDDDGQTITLDWALPPNQIAQRGFAWTQRGLGEVWTSDPLPWSGGFFSSAGRYQFDAATPNTDVLVFATNGSTLFRRGDTGEAATKSVYTGHYTLPIFADFSGDGRTDLLFQSGFVSPWLYGPNWAPLWQQPGPLPTYTMAGALVPCATGARYVTPYLRSPRFRVHDAQTGAVLSDLVAAGGALFDTEVTAQASGAALGFLSNASVITTPRGESLILFGSSDGHLYAVNGCDAVSLAWALDVGTPLGEPSIGDWDGDEHEELLIGAATGHVLGIDFGRLPAPTVTARRTSHHDWHVTWSAVEGAVGYEYALVEPDGSPAWDPPYRATRAKHVRVATNHTLAGRQFRLAVRALSARANAWQRRTVAAPCGHRPTPSSRARRLEFAARPLVRGRRRRRARPLRDLAGICDG